jgi:hypothetical protein
VALKPLIGEEAVLAFLAIEWWSVVNHFRVNLREEK